jgi:hypothetical protein
VEREPYEEHDDGKEEDARQIWRSICRFATKMPMPSKTAPLR